MSGFPKKGAKPCFPIFFQLSWQIFSGQRGSFGTGTSLITASGSCQSMRGIYVSSGEEIFLAAYPCMPFWCHVWDGVFFYETPQCNKHAHADATDRLGRGVFIVTLSLIHIECRPSSLGSGCAGSKSDCEWRTNGGDAGRWIVSVGQHEVWILSVDC